MRFNPSLNPLEARKPFDKLFHSICTICFHLVRNVPVYIEGKRRCVMPKTLLYSLNIIASWMETTALLYSFVGPRAEFARILGFFQKQRKNTHNSRK